MFLGSFSHPITKHLTGVSGKNRNSSAGNKSTAKVKVKGAVKRTLFKSCNNEKQRKEESVLLLMTIF